MSDEKRDMRKTEITRVNGPVVFAGGMQNVRLGDEVEVGSEGLMGEIIGLEDSGAVIQVYEDTRGIKPGEPVKSKGAPLSVVLGPGILKSIYDGIQRPLKRMEQQSGAFISRGQSVSGIDLEQKWSFTPRAEVGKSVSSGNLLGEVPETQTLTHKIMVPPNIEGELIWLAETGEYRVNEEIARIKIGSQERSLTMMQRWPIRQARPYKQRLLPREPMITGQRVIDFFFPVARGGACAIPGGFGTGKTVTQHQLAKWSDVDLIIYIGCGERGNEMTQVLDEFPHLKDPRSGKPLMERTVLIANTSNMPVTAREASIYTGVTIAEYYRDMGLDVAVMADSTSRWAEALREISGRLEELPVEEGYPAYLASRIGGIYERAGQVAPLGGESSQKGSLTIIGAVSPPGGDFSEPVVSHTKRFVRTFWGLDKELASARHFPAIHWDTSYSEYDVSEWWDQHSDLPWSTLRKQALDILAEDDRLQNIVKLIGPDALPDRQRVVLEVARMIKEAFLQQGAFSELDSFCSPEKQLAMMDVILHFNEKARQASQSGMPVHEIMASDVAGEIFRIKENYSAEQIDQIEEIKKSIDEQISEEGGEF